MSINAIDLEIKQFYKIVNCKESQESANASERRIVAIEHDKLELVRETCTNMINLILAW